MINNCCYLLTPQQGVYQVLGQHKQKVAIPYRE
jgi:hypothetical protein